MLCHNKVFVADLTILDLLIVTTSMTNLVEQLDNIDVRFDDEPGYWVQLKNSVRHDIEGSEPETLENIADDGLVWFEFYTADVSSTVDENELLEIIQRFETVCEEATELDGVVRKQEYRD